jgi:Retrotransposon gag protein
VAASEITPRAVQRIDLPLLDRKLDGPGSYLSWSRRVRYTLEGKDLEGYLTGDKKESAEGYPEGAEWNSTHMTIYMWLLSSLTPSIASTVDGIDRVKDVLEKLKRAYDGVGNNLRVFQIEREIETVVQGDRSIQEYATDLERLWADYDHLSPAACCKNPECKRGARDTQMRTMHFMSGLNPAFELRCAVLLAQPKIPALEETISAMVQEESRIRLQSGAARLSGVKSALAVSKLGNTGYRGETRECYNYGEVGHLKQFCTKPPNERNLGGRGQSRGRDRDRGGRRGGRGGYQTHLTVVEGESEETVVFTEEDHEFLEMLKRKLKAASEEKRVLDDASTSASSRGNIASFTHSAIGICDTLALASISTTRSPDWIVDYGASRHVTGAAREFSSYTHLAVPESIQVADGTAQLVIGKGTVQCTNNLTLFNVLHAPSFPVNLLSISVIISQLKCVVLFDISKVIFQEKETGRRLGTDI